jgi:hypothetical protein
VQFALMDSRFLVAVEEFDGVLDRENVVGLVRVHLVENRRERGRLAGTGRASDQDNSVS